LIVNLPWEIEININIARLSDTYINYQVVLPLARPVEIWDVTGTDLIWSTRLEADRKESICLLLRSCIEQKGRN